MKLKLKKKKQCWSADLVDIQRAEHDQVSLSLLCARHPGRICNVTSGRLIRAWACVMKWRKPRGRKCLSTKGHFRIAKTIRIATAGGVTSCYLTRNKCVGVKGCAGISAGENVIITGQEEVCDIMPVKHEWNRERERESSGFVFFTKPTLDTVDWKMLNSTLEDTRVFPNKPKNPLCAEHCVCILVERKT